MIKKLLPLCLAVLVLAGCSTTITNLTPSQQTRSKAGLYPFEVMYECTQQSAVKETVRAFVQVGLDEYPMQRTALMNNRWETLIPVPANQEFVNYQYKFIYEYRSMPNRKEDSKLSAPFRLQILDK